MNSAVYLDHNATTVVRDAASRAMAAVCAQPGNPSSVHRFGRIARRTLEQARETIAALINAKPQEVTFTSGGTEANNLALLGVGRDRILVSGVEHPSVLKVPNAQPVPVDSDGIIDLAALDSMLLSSNAPAIVSVMLANNETGVIEPVHAAAEIAHRHAALMHCDAVQAAGKTPVDFAALGCDLMSVSAHKIGGPMGVGALIAGDGIEITGRTFGGGQEKGLRTGTENLAGIAGFGSAAEAALAALDDFAGLAQLRDRLEAGVRERSPETVIFGHDVQRLANTAMLTMPGVDAETQVIAFDLAGIAVSAGSACSSGKTKASGVLKAMGVDETHAAHAIRVSLGWTSEQADVDAFLAAWAKIQSKGSADAKAPAA